MKKIIYTAVSVILCFIICSCSLLQHEPSESIHLPQVSEEYFRINELSDEGMHELEEKVSALAITDFIHTNRIAEIEKRGFTVTVENISIYDCNEILFELVLTKEDGASLRLQACGILMYRYQSETDRLYTHINDLNVLWGNIGIYDSQIVFSNINTMSLWNAETLQKTFRQPDMSFTDGKEFFFILDSVKSSDGYTVVYYSSEGSGFVKLSSDGQPVGRPVQYYGEEYTLFGTQNISFSETLNTKFHASTLMHCFYADSNEKQFFIQRKTIYGYLDDEFEMYDFESYDLKSSFNVASYRVNQYDFKVYGMMSYKSNYDSTYSTSYLAVKKENGTAIDTIFFKADISPSEFGMDKSTGWNTYMNISLSSDMNKLMLGCSKTDTVIDIDFSAHTANVYKSADMPQMPEISKSPNTQHVLYCGWAGDKTSLVVRILSGSCMMNHLADVYGQRGVDWLAGFTTHEYIYILTGNQFTVFRWEGSNNWTKVVTVRDRVTVDDKTVKKMCNIYM